jgi:putative PIN family toxin of toxin-antitoxin system
MIRVVLDTNVIVSAMLTRRGNEAQVLRFSLHGILLPCVTKEILAEYREVLGRSKFSKLPKNEVSVLLQGLSLGLIVHPEFVLNISPDSKDNRFLECSQAANANFLITGNKRHFPALWKCTKVVSARRLLDELFPTEQNHSTK